MKISKKMTFAEALAKHPELAEIFLEQGLHCIGCPVASSESIESGAEAHGVDVDELLAALNRKITKK